MTTQESNPQDAPVDPIRLCAPEACVVRAEIDAAGVTLEELRGAVSTYLHCSLYGLRMVQQNLGLPVEKDGQITPREDCGISSTDQGQARRLINEHRAIERAASLEQQAEPQALASRQRGTYFVRDAAHTGNPGHRV